MTSLTPRVCFGILAVMISAGLGFAEESSPAAAAPAPEQGLKILNSKVVRVVYPYDLALAGTDATVDVSYLVDANGAATSATVTKTSHPEAGAAFLAALDEMVFETDLVDGKPVLSDEQTLSVSLRQLQLPADLTFINVIKNPAAVVVGAREVDGGLKPAARLSAAVFPSSLRKSGVKQGRAILEFYIDPAGIVRLPKVLSATDPALGWSAATAVLTWRFAPPLKGGQPAIVKVTGLPVDFKAPAEAAAPPEPAGSALKAEILVEAPLIINAQLKISAEIVGDLPQRILLEVSPDGTLNRDFDLSITNPNVTAVSKVTLKAGEIPPARIKFTPTTPELTGSAAIKR